MYFYFWNTSIFSKSLCLASKETVESRNSPQKWSKFVGRIIHKKQKFHIDLEILYRLNEAL